MSRDYPAFLFYPEDFLAGTAEMSNAEVGIYMRCLCHQWHKGFVPDDPIRVSRIAHATTDEMAHGWEAVKAKFKDCGNGQLKNQKMERVRTELKKSARIRSASGKAGAAARWGDGKRNASALPDSCESDRKTVASRVGDGDGDGIALELPEILRCQEFRDEFAKWLAYKKERRESYKPTGLSGVIDAAEKRAKLHGVRAVVEAMQSARANGWQGWDQKSLFGGSDNGKRPSGHIQGPGQRFRG